jgi:hypothetical protein
MKKLVSVPVGPDPKIAKYRPGQGGGEYLDYGYAHNRLHPGGSLKSIIHELTQLQKEYRDRFQDMTFVEKNDCGCPYACSCSPSYILYGKRYETDLEYNFRLQQEAKLKAVQEQRERAEYEKLRTKFEKSEERG